MKQVVFVAGTAYSGSSMLDMMLGNSASSFSMGEVKYLFTPTKKFHISTYCGCGEASCTLWSELRKSGKYKFYGEIFNRFKNLQTIIDSSKDLFWIKDQKINLKRMGIPTRVVLIWKSPEEFALSRYKRNNLDGWQRAWVNYHKLFLSLNENWKSVEYRSLAQNSTDTMKKICSVLSINYIDKMEHYWKKKHHILFGNLSAKYHTFEKNDQKFKNTIQNLDSIESQINSAADIFQNNYRQIVYNQNYEEKLPKSVIDSSKNEIFNELSSVIKSKDVNCDSDNFKVNENTKSLLMPKTVIELYRLKRFLKEKFFYLRNLTK